MSEKNYNSKRGSESDASNVTVSPMKKLKLDDYSHNNITVVISSSSSDVASLTADSAQGEEYSVTSEGEDDDEQNSSISSGCFNSETNETESNNFPTAVVDLKSKERNPVKEALGEIITERDDQKNPREVSISPTSEEIEEFFSKLENDGAKDRFIEKYNFDIVNDEPLEGRYLWDRIKP